MVTLHNNPLYTQLFLLSNKIQQHPQYMKASLIKTNYIPLGNPLILLDILIPHLLNIDDILKPNKIILMFNLLKHLQMTYLLFYFSKISYY